MNHTNPVTWTWWLSECILQLIDSSILPRGWLGTTNLPNTLGINSNVHYLDFLLWSRFFTKLILIGDILWSIVKVFVLQIMRWNSCVNWICVISKQICTHFVLTRIITKAIHWALIGIISIISRVWRTLAIFCVNRKIIMSTKHKRSIILVKYK